MIVYFFIWFAIHFWQMYVHLELDINVVVLFGLSWLYCLNLCEGINGYGCKLLDPSCCEISTNNRSKDVTDVSLLGLQEAYNAFDNRCGVLLQDPCKSEIVLKNETSARGPKRKGRIAKGLFPSTVPTAVIFLLSWDPPGRLRQSLNVEQLSDGLHLSCLLHVSISSQGFLGIETKFLVFLECCIYCPAVSVRHLFWSVGPGGNTIQHTRLAQW